MTTDARTHAAAVAFPARAAGLSAVRAPHLVSALAAVALVAAALVAGVAAARAEEQRWVYSVASLLFEEKNEGAALQQAAFQQPDLLPLYGSSELEHGEQFNASRLFSTFPTGFDVFMVGKAGTTCITHLERLAAVGPELRDKKVVISFTPSELLSDELNQEDYAGNFSPLQAGALVFSTDLSFELRRQAAKRMLDYPKPLEQDRLLAFAVRALADDSALSHVLYQAALPLGKLEQLVYSLQDHWAVISYFREHGKHSPEQNPSVREPSPLDWSALESEAEQQQVKKVRAQPNPFSFAPNFWHRFAEHVLRERNAYTDEGFIRDLEQSRGWTNFELLLRLLKERGARPLVLTPPLSAPFWDFAGVSPAARQVYYQRLRVLSVRYEVPILAFPEHEGDRYFVEDRGSHPSAKGWVYYDQVIDAFYHDRPLPTVTP